MTEIDRRARLSIESNDAGREVADLPLELRHVVHLAPQCVVISGMMLHQIGSELEGRLALTLPRIETLPCTLHCLRGKALRVSDNDGFKRQIGKPHLD